MRGETVTGITTFQMDEGMDTGAMLRSASVTIGPEATAGELAARLSVLGAEVLVDTLDELDALTPKAQRHEDATLAPRLKRIDGYLDWSRPARELVKRIRGCNPSPGARARGPAAAPRPARAPGRGGRAGHRDRRRLAPPHRGPAGKPPRDVLGGLSARRPTHAGRRALQAPRGG